MIEIPEPDYVGEIRSHGGPYAQMTHMAVEREIIREKAWIEDPLTHHMRYMRLVMPWVTHDPNIVRLKAETLKCEETGRKLFHMMGHASSGKTNFMVADAFEMILTHPHNSECFVASPYRSSSEYLLWAAFNNMADELAMSGIPVFKRVGVISVRPERWSGPGTITLVSFHAVGVLRGKKLVDPDKGQLGIYLDEAGEFTNFSILEIISNLKSQRGLRVRTGTNFRKIDGLDGKFHEPEDFEWGDLQRESSYSWDSVNGGYSVRLRAKMSPNIVLGEDYYRYLLRQAEHEDLLRYGIDSPFYLSQGDAFPSISSINRLIISESDIQGGRVYEDVELQDGERFAFLDPSFTQHGDAAIMASGTLGRERHDAVHKIRLDPQVELPVNENAVWTEDDIRLALKLRAGRPLAPTHVEGEKMTPYDMCAMAAGRYLLEHNIPFGNFGYDDSMRGALTYSMVFFLGEGCTSVYYGGPPSNKLTFPAEFKWTNVGPAKRRQRVRMRGDELYVNAVSQMWFTTVGMIKAGLIRNGFGSQKALDQLKMRLKTEPKSGQAVKKLSIENKSDFKDHSRNRSPDQGDALCGLVWMTVDRKLAPEADKSESSHRGGVDVVRQLMASGVKRKPRLKSLSR
ncbi:MAG: hypothetical protein GY871_13335 [Actinomycetales bacterium]|nr:hypothetical protein [Actinomycetales bacterium]